MDPMGHHNHDLHGFRSSLNVQPRRDLLDL
ncbi:Uncharacterised protein [Vibrio cholerae]|nr:Uncharacterised protein [Vibrio cholerae]